MSFQDVIQNYWQSFIVAPLAFLSVKMFSLNATVKVHDTQIQDLRNTCENLCKSQQKTNELLSEINGTLKEHLRASSPD